MNTGYLSEKKRKKKCNFKISRLATLALVFILVMSLTSCTTYDAFYETFIEKGAGDSNKVKIGIFEPLSGKDKEFGKLELEGIELANQLFPEVLGKTIELVVVDNQSDIYVAESVAKELVSKNVSVVLGSYGSANSLVAAKIFEEAKIPAIAITNTNPLVTSYNPYYFRVCMLDTAQCEALTRYAIGNEFAATAAVLRPEKNDYAMAMAERLAASFKRRLGNEASVVASLSYNAQKEDFKNELLKIKESGASVVFLPENPKKAIEIIKQARKLGLTQTFIGTDQWDNDEFINEAKNIGGGKISFSTAFDAKTDMTVMFDKFIEVYKKEYGNKSNPQSAVALGFDAYLLAVNAINYSRTSDDGKLIKNQLAQTRAFPGASGAINLDPNGDPIKSVVVYSIAKGQKIVEHTIEPQFFNSLIENEGLDGTTQVLPKTEKTDK